MKHRVLRITIALVVVLPLAFAPQATADDSPNARDIVELLRAHDARFDNCSIQWTQREVRHVDERAEFYQLQFNDRKFGREPLPEPASFPDPYDATIVQNCQMTVRGDEFTISFVRLTDWHGHPQPASEPIFCQRSGTLVKTLDLNSEHRFLYLQDVENSTNLLWKRTAYGMSLGVGYSEWLKDVRSLERSDSGWSLKGTMQLFGVDRTDCELELDDDLIVRTARLYCVVGKDGLTRERLFEFTSAGQHEDAEGPLLAESGTFCETTVIAVVGGESREVNRPGDNWTLEAGPVEFELSDDRYSELTQLGEDSVEEVLDQRRR